MGYDVSFHPISPEEMREWYFTPLTWIQQGQEEKVLALAAQHGMEDFYAEKYLNTLRVGAETESNELFDKSHGFYIAVIQGFFRDYYYTRGIAFSFLVEQKPEYARYFTSWEQITPVSFPNPMQKQTGKIVVKFQRRGKPTNSALLESHYQSEHLQDIGMSRPICCYTSK